MPTSQDVLLAWHRLRNALGAAGVGTWHVDLRTNLAIHDESLNRILGLDAVEAEGSLDDADFTRIHPGDNARVMGAIKEAVAEHREYGLEYRIVRAGGEIRSLQDRGRIILDDDASPRFATRAVMDVTERRQLEDHERALAEERGAADSRPRAGELREGRNPHHALPRTAHTTQRGARMDPHAARWHGAARTNGGHPRDHRAHAAAQMQIVEELLELSSMAPGNLRLNVTPVDLRELIGGAVETIRPAADAKTITVQVWIAEAVRDIAGDASRLRQVPWNLLANAVTFTRAGGRVEVKAAEGPIDVEITVSDTGQGISPDTRSCGACAHCPSVLGNIPAVALTAFTDPQRVRHAFAGFDGTPRQNPSSRTGSRTRSPKFCGSGDLRSPRVAVQEPAQLGGDHVGRARLD
jgi:PAS domain S-box-containing protein